MIPGKDLAWHYDACIEMWNEIAEMLEENERSEALKAKAQSKINKKYKPKGGCFACEAHLVVDKHCANCPFNVSYMDYGCFTESSPYNSFSQGKGTQQDAIAIAQLFIDYYPK